MKRIALKDSEPITRRLIARAEKIATTGMRNEWTLSGSAHLERRVALLLDELKSTRTMETKSNYEFDQFEMKLSTELMQMEQRTPKYSHYRYPEREKMLRSKQRLAEDRRRFCIELDRRLQNLYKELLELVEAHEHVRSLAEFRR